MKRMVKPVFLAESFQSVSFCFHFAEVVCEPGRSVNKENEEKKMDFLSFLSLAQICTSNVWLVSFEMSWTADSGPVLLSRLSSSEMAKRIRPKKQTFVHLTNLISPLSTL
ncbi:hypothetical protein NL108_017706 [Boleophthalmus pectinirostris]|nr:hypothetical protein NL108_017706 [Boleophthalmus pectinirostris]